MKYIKTYEKRSEEVSADLLADLLNENPLSETHDFYIFLAGEKFEEDENGKYDKKLNIENMIRITPDVKSVGSMKGLQMRAMFQQNVKLYHIWLPQEIRDDIEGKGSNLESWLVKLIDKYKRRGDPTGEGKKVMDDVIQRKRDINRYNV